MEYYESCQTCDEYKEDKFHNCKTCDSDYTYIIDYNENNLNCYQNCTYYHYYNNTNQKYYCTEENKCPLDYNKLIPEKNECIDDCSKDNEYKYEFQKRCIKDCPSNTEKMDYFCKLNCPKEYPYEIVSTQQCVSISNCSVNDLQNKYCIINYISNETNDNTKMEEEMISNVQKALTSGFNTSNVDNGKDIEIEQENSNTKVTVSSSENQKKAEKEKNNITTINLGECEKKLKEHYNIPLDKNLYIFTIKVSQENIKAVKMGYEVYYPLNGQNLELLDLSICENEKVDITTPMELTDDIDKLNSSSDYYNDICYTSTTENGTDISLKDRQIEYVESNKTICEENCEFTHYNYETGKAVCSCEVKIKLPLISEIKFDKYKLYDSFTDIKQIANLNIMKCYKILFSKKGISKNYGCYIIIPIFILHIIFTFLLYLKELDKIKLIIKNILFAKKNWNKLSKLFEKDIKKNKNNKENIYDLNSINNKNIINNKGVINNKNKIFNKNN